MTTAPIKKRSRAPTTKLDDPTGAALQKQQLALATSQYGRGKKIHTRSIKDKKLRSNLSALEDRYRDAALKAKDAEILLENTSGLLEAEGELERTYKVRQDEIRDSVGVETAKKGFELRLPDTSGPYVADYSRNGRDLLLAGRKGHVATMDWRDGKLGCELQLGETIRDAKWLHNNQFFAVAQKRSVYIYDTQGVEIHNLRDHVEPAYMEFLPFHFLLATVGLGGYLKYQDTSTGKLVAQMPTKLGSPTSFAQNRHNAIIHVGHNNGTVSLWSPNDPKPLVKILAHRGPVRAMSMDREGRYMVTTGQDTKMAVWDIRQFKQVNSFTLRQPGSSVAVSDRNLTAVGWGTQVSVWKDLFTKSDAEAAATSSDPTLSGGFKSTYMSWGGQGDSISRVSWCPFEDVLGTSHNHGFSSILVPGAGEPNYDSLEINPYENTKQRQESEVRGLLQKLQPEMISLDPEMIGKLDLVSDAQRRLERDLDRDLKKEEADKLLDMRNRGRGKNSSLRKALRKSGRKNVIDERKVKVMEIRKEEAEKRKRELDGKTRDELGPALARFGPKPTR